MALVVGTNSWLTEAEANTYFDDRLFSADYWTDGASDNSPALTTAYQWLNAGRFSFPATATQNMKDAQCEMAFFLLQHQPDIDLRMGLQSQGVIAAGVVKEKYKDVNYLELPFPPLVYELIEGYDNQKSAYLVNLERNEEEGVDYNAFANRHTDES